MRRLLLMALALGAAVGLSGLTAGPATAKSFSITDVQIDARVMRNGDVRVHEARTLAFSGQFSFVYWDYATQGSDGIRVRGAAGPEGPYQPTGEALAGGTGPERTYMVSDDGRTVQVKLFFDLADTSATFSVDYTALGAAKRWNDAAELYWQFVGADTSVPSDHVTVTIHLPDGVRKDQVRAWTHGPLWGNVTIQPDASVVSTISPLPANTFVEPRILFPASALSRATPLTESRLQAVLAEEQALADQANRDRMWARVRVVLWSIVGFGAPLLAIVLILVLYLRYGREPRTQFQAQYLRDIPQPPTPPALAGFIWRMGAVDRDDATATLLDLVDRGVIAIERVVKEESGLLGTHQDVSYRLTLREDKLPGLMGFEDKLVRFLFFDIAGEWSFVLADLKGMAKDKRTEFASGYTEWTKAVKEEGTQRGYLDPTADRMAFVGAAVGFVAAVAAGAAAVFSGWFWFFIGVPVGILLVYRARGIKRRSKEAAELHAQLQALRRYLKDFGRLQEKPPDAVVLWEHFLVFAVVFGIADEVIKAMQVTVPEILEDPGFRTMTFMMVATPDGGPSPFSAMDQSFSQAISVATSSSSSGSGGGGGFSGGGGGGGGGGGFGAG